MGNRRGGDQPEAEAPAAKPFLVVLVRKGVKPPPLPTVCRENRLLKLKRAYALRNRKVFVTHTDKPNLAPPQYKKGAMAGEALGGGGGAALVARGDEGSGQEKEPRFNTSWQTPTCAKVALEHYNRLNEDQYEMVKALKSIPFTFNGIWLHVNFLAKLKGATHCPDLLPKFFFAEVKPEPDGVKGMSCVSCVQIDPGMQVWFMCIQ
uniref:DUF3615 domain-containing protein n=1 Tax=Leersia perrieri TaxID=77586 RepID=A0A0D9W130_9ORYZ